MSEKVITEVPNPPSVMKIEWGRDDQGNLWTQNYEAVQELMRRGESARLELIAVRSDRDQWRFNAWALAAMLTVLLIAQAVTR